MQEGEFRDWARRAFGAYEERLRRLEERPVASVARIETPGKVQGELESRGVRVFGVVRGGGVWALAIAYLTDDGRPMTGWKRGGVMGRTRSVVRRRFLRLRCLSRFGRWRGLRGRPRGKPTKEPLERTRPKVLPPRPPRVEYRGGEGFCARLEADGSSE